MANYENIVLDLEREELEESFPDVKLYIKLFACYLVQNKLYDAKFLWKRVPLSFKTENEDLNELYLLLKALISNNIQDFLKHIKRDWPEEIKSIMDDLLRSAQGNVVSTIENAYTWIVRENLIEAIDVYQNQLTECSSNNKTGDNQSNVSHINTATVSSEHQLSRLTGFVSFLEN
ncbi:COP9 signalosome complex subunit 8 [Stomoxys calcitrans]|uniref:CSN8/PSMD8/EIF3K domain-containing protein n=1 Tax=Stomoxys calcitrans TaxID=35570 RepID=A0A1I8NPK2_STOCA|nr:COP9 signalosome complex subunit 8 [Stomoxys calcitrans]